MFWIVITCLRYTWQNIFWGSVATSTVVCSFQFVTAFFGQYYTPGWWQVLFRHLTSGCVLFSGPHISRWCLLMDLEVTPCDRVVLLHCWSITYFSRIWVCTCYELVLSLSLVSSPGLPWMRLFFPTCSSQGTMCLMCSLWLLFAGLPFSFPIYFSCPVTLCLCEGWRLFLFCLE